MLNKGHIHYNITWYTTKNSRVPCHWYMYRIWGNRRSGRHEPV